MTTAVQAPEKTQASTSIWTIDGGHSHVEFAVKHMMVSTVKGRFKDLSGTLNIDEGNPAASTIEAAIEVASVDTGAEQRDEHLRSDDFFNATEYPQIRFRSTGITGKDDDWKMEGELTIRDITKPVVLDVEFDGRGTDAYGGERAGFTARTKFNRRDFGVNWNGLIEAGGVVVSDTVKVTLNIQAVRQN